MKISDISDLYFFEEKDKNKAIGFTVTYSDGKFKNYVAYYSDNNKKDIFSTIKRKRDSLVRKFEAQINSF